MPPWPKVIQPQSTSHRASAFLKEILSVIKSTRPSNYFIKAKILLGSETRPSVTRNPSRFKPVKAVQASSQERKSMNLESYRTIKKCEQLMCRDRRIQSLEEENRALRARLKSCSKQYPCPLCEKSFARSNDLYNHLKVSDEKHKKLAQKQCNQCEKGFTRWNYFRKHMKAHEQKASEFDACTCLVAAPFCHLSRAYADLL